MDATLDRAARQAISKARSVLVMEHPFFATMALRLRLKEDTACRDLWTDGKTLGYNPVYVTTLPEDKLVGAQAHEILHLAFGHHLRRGKRDIGLWNKACDLSINHILLDAGFSLPKGFLTDPAYVGLSADEIYEALVQLQDSSPNGGATSGEQTAPVDDTEGTDSMKFDGGQETEEESAVGGASDDKETQSEDTHITRPARGRQAENAANESKNGDHENQTDFVGEVRDFLDGEGRQNPHEQRKALQEADIALHQALQSALHMGDMPAGFVRLLKKECRLQLDWRELLQRFLEQCADNDYSWTTPNRRYLHQGIYLPSRREARLPHVALAIDSSGSVDEQVLAAFCSELSSILDAYDTTLTVLFHDNRIQGETTFTRMDFPLSLTPQGGGGTDFRPVCAHIAEQNLHPTCLIWFTDLECSLFPPEPD